MVSSLKARAHYAGKRLLSQQRRNSVKRWLITRRKKWPQFYILVHGTFTARTLVNQLRSRITDDFEILMVHSAYDRLLPMYSGTVGELVTELLEFCGTNRTLVMPAFVLGGRNYDPCEFYRRNPFDARRTPSEMGLVTEIFRRLSGARRSLHPTHSITALGPLAMELTQSHHLAPTRTGKGTPFETMAQRRTTIAGLGVEYFRCLTQMHTAEDFLGSSFPVKFERRQISVNVIASDGARLGYPLTVNRTDRPMDASILCTLLSRSELLEWRFRGARMFITSAGVVTKRLIEAAACGASIYGPI